MGRGNAGTWNWAGGPGDSLLAFEGTQDLLELAHLAVPGVLP